MTADVIHGDALAVLKNMAAESVDCIATDGPYGWEFMGSAWDKALPDPAIWSECLRVLKPGGLAFIMSGPRMDCLWRLGRDLEAAGFDLSFSCITHIFRSGFPKAGDLSRQYDAAAFSQWIKTTLELVVCPDHKELRDTQGRLTGICHWCHALWYWENELTRHYYRKVVSAAVNGEWFIPSDGVNRKPKDPASTFGVYEPMSSARKHNKLGASLLAALLARHWEPLEELQRLEVWAPHSAAARRRGGNWRSRSGASP